MSNSNLLRTAMASLLAIGAKADGAGATLADLAGFAR
jgi:hypothetical protein